ncbi:hypothetical protein PR048_004771 [Dryococelus australis]|uniref:Transposase n=1 Tax=Dryococelus australis TaxID=614101 RepID=A0ABQ9I773_9NEOP|nr:hypothetical protein PR048_004771 [Dryococelus australis]
MTPYERKSERVLTTQETLEEAKRKIDAGDSKRKVARDLGIKESTLRKRLKAGTVPVSLGRFKKALSDEMEQELAKHCKDMDNRFHGLTRKHITKVAFNFAEMNRVSEKFNQGKRWLEKIELCSVARAVGFNKVQVSRFFDNLKHCRIQKKFSAHRIFNMNETGVSTVPSKTRKIISLKGKKTICKVSSAERGQTVTDVCSMSATGIFGAACSATVRVQLAERAIKATGIEPFDPDIISEDLFTPSLVTTQIPDELHPPETVSTEAQKKSSSSDLNNEQEKEEKEKEKQETEKAKAHRVLLKARHEAEKKNEKTKRLKSNKQNPCVICIDWWHEGCSSSTFRVRLLLMRTLALTDADS